MIRFCVPLFTALVMSPAFAAAEKVLHLGLISVYEDPDHDQFKRMDALLRSLGAPEDVVSLRNKVLRTKYEKSPPIFQELDAELAARLGGSDEVFDRVIVQADERDFLKFWDGFDQDRPLLSPLAGHLAPNARIVFTGGPALGPIDASGKAMYQDRVPALLEKWGVPGATFVAATSPVHLAAPPAEAWGRRITTAIGLGLAGAGGVAITYIPREQTWIDFLVPVGGLAWMAGAFMVNNVIERMTDPKYNPNELIHIGELLRMDHLAIGSGLTALAGGLWYSGTGIIDQKFMVFSAGYAAALWVFYGYLMKGDQFTAFLRREKSPLNEGLTFTREGADLIQTRATKMNDPDLYRCASILNSVILN